MRRYMRYYKQKQRKKQKQKEGNVQHFLTPKSYAFWKRSPVPKFLAQKKMVLLRQQN